jgi:hypothetical protein
VAPHHQGARAHPRPRRPMVSPPRSSFPSQFPPVISSRCIIFAYITPQSTRGLYIVFSSYFCFELFLSGVDLSFESTMASSSDDKEKAPPKDNHQDLQPKEEVESEAEEEDQSSRPSTMIASVGVVTSHDKFKKSAWIRTRGGVPRHILAPRTSPSGNNPFHILIHEHQFQKVPRS